jgi:hypothetical protein
MKPSVFLLFCLPLYTVAQVDSSSTKNHFVFSSEYKNCINDSKLRRFISSDTNFLWSPLRDSENEYLINEYRQVIEKINAKTKSVTVGISQKCFNLAVLNDEKANRNRGASFEIFEVYCDAENTTRIIGMMNNLKAIKTLDWPDASIPVIFHLYENYLYVFLNVSDDYEFETPASQQRFERITNHIIQSITAEKK